MRDADRLQHNHLRDRPGLFGRQVPEGMVMNEQQSGVTMEPVVDAVAEAERLAEVVSEKAWRALMSKMRPDLSKDALSKLWTDIQSEKVINDWLSRCDDKPELTMPQRMHLSAAITALRRP